MFNKYEKQRKRRRKEISLELQKATKMIKFSHTSQKKKIQQ